MWSGENGGEQQMAQNAQWFNPMMYQNMNNADVDWATLAQQWIKMKETFPTVDQMNVLAPPPPPPLPSSSSNQKKEEEDDKHDDGEKGEAPMDMELDTKDEDSKEEGLNGTWGAGQWNNWQQWGWGWNGSDPKQLATYSAMNYPGFVDPLLAYPTGPDASTSGQTSPSEHGASKYKSFPSQFIRHPNRTWKKGDRSSDNRQTRDNSKYDRSESPEEQTELDAAKRKKLPAWIREGLEKMEREKQRQLQKEKEKQMKADQKAREPEFDPLNPTKSKFDSEPEEDDDGHSSNEEQNSTTNRSLPPPILPKSSFEYPPEPLQIQRLTKPEILDKVMGIVRKELTQLLMRITTEEIENCCHEVLSTFPSSKAPQHTQQRSQPKAAKEIIGLGIYDSASESSAEEEEEDVDDNRTNMKSVQESEELLREQLFKRRREFSRIEKEIERKIQLQEEQERRAQLEVEESDQSDDDDNGGNDRLDQVHKNNSENQANADEENLSRSLSQQDQYNPEKAGETSSEDEGTNTKQESLSPISKKQSKRNKSRSRSTSRSNRRERSRSESRQRYDESRNHSRRKRERSRSNSRQTERNCRDGSYSREIDKKRRKRSYSRGKDSRKGGHDSKNKYRSHSRDTESRSRRSYSKDKSHKKKKSKRSSSKERKEKRKSDNSNRDRSDESKYSHKSNKRHRSRSHSRNTYDDKERYDKKSKKYSHYDDEYERTTKRSRYSVSPSPKSSKSRKHKRSRSRSYDRYSSTSSKYRR